MSMICNVPWDISWNKRPFTGITYDVTRDSSHVMDIAMEVRFELWAIPLDVPKYAHGMRDI